MSRHDSWWDGMKCIFQHRQCVRDWYCYEYRNMTGCLWGTLLREWTKSGVYHLHTQSTLVNKTLYWHMWLSLAFDVPRKYSVKSTRNVPSHFLTSGTLPRRMQTNICNNRKLTMTWPWPTSHLHSLDPTRMTSSPAQPNFKGTSKFTACWPKLLWEKALTWSQMIPISVSINLH